MYRFIFSKTFRTGIIIGIVGALLAGIFFVSLIRGLPSVETIATAQVKESTRIYDRTGTTLLYELYRGERRTRIPLPDIPKTVREATISIEDKDFYSHEAISIRGIIRALIANISRGSIVQGGSTITQQLARTMFLSTNRNLIRKAKELILAFRIERQYDKDKILELYLNQVPYGGEVYGVESASQTFFKKHAKDLNLAESAVLASLPKGPSYYSPWGSRVEELLARKNLVLDRMENLGYITAQEAERAKKEEVVFAPPQTNITAPHFVNAVTKYLISTYGEEFVRTAGLTVITTLDARLQEAAQTAVAKGAARNEELYDGTNAALVAEDPKTGQILSLVGSRDYFDTENDGNFDVASLGLRQPGSTIKPFAYYTAFLKGYTPDTIVFDVPTDFNTTDNPDAAYAPENFDSIFHGPVPMRRGLGQSMNVPSVKTLYLAGVPEVVKTAQKFGLTTLTEPWRYGLALALGGGEVRLVDLVGAYSVFAADGMRHKQTMILEVRNKEGKVLEKFSDQVSQVGDTQSVRLINDILSDSDLRSGLFRSSLSLTVFPGYDVALKTGTTNDYRDAWAVGYTPSLVVGVWAGNSDNRPMQQRGSSILAAVPIWSEFLNEVISGFPHDSFPQPDPLFIDKPILNGSYIFTYELNGQMYPQLHDTLFYVEKDNPRGPQPINPGRDPQFERWETALQEWAKTNIDHYETYNESVPPGARLVGGTRSGIAIEITSPGQGTFVGSRDSLTVEGSARSSSPIASIEVFLNGAAVAKDVGRFDPPYTFRFTIQNPGLKTQNLLRVSLQTALGETAQEKIIFYEK